MRSGPCAYAGEVSLLSYLARRRKGRVLAVKWGLNPNSSSLGVDVTFLLFGATFLSISTPVVAALVRMKMARTAETKPKDSDGLA